MQYKIISYTWPAHLEEEINTLAKEGWRLMNPGVQMSCVGTDIYYYCTLWKSDGTH